MGKVYSYLRFSSKAQELGDSKRRQLTYAQEYCNQNGLTLETTTFEDLGISAWKSKNATDGQLGVFLRAVDDGLIASDSTLLVEHLDRVTRAEPTVALQLFTSIINRGLTIITLADKQVYNRASLKSDLSKLLSSILKIVQANEANEDRSMRVRAALNKNLEQGIKSRRCPSWLTVTEDRKLFVLIPERVQLVQRIFEWSAKGRGVHQIARLLNEEGVPHLGKSKTPGKVKTWKGVELARILRDRSVLGHQNARTAKVVRENHYPQIIEPTLFYEVQTAMERRNKIGKGRKGDEYLQNLLSGLLRCECGDKIRFIRSTRRPHMRCERAITKGGCDGPYFAYKPLEDELLAWLLLDADDRLIGEFEPAESTAAPELREKIVRRKTRRKRLFDFVMDNDIKDDDAQQELNKLRDEITDLEEQLRKLEAASRAQPEDAAEANHALYYEHYNAHMNEAPAAVLYDIRNRVQEALRRSIKRVTLMTGDWFEKEGGPPRRRFQLTFGKAPEVQFDLFCKASAV